MNEEKEVTEETQPLVLEKLQAKFSDALLAVRKSVMVLPLLSTKKTVSHCWNI